MDIKGIRIGVVLIAFVLTLSIGFGVQRVAHQHRVIAPLYERFQSIDGVQDLEVEETQRGIGLVLQLGPISSLEKVIGLVRQEAVNARLVGDITIVDHADSRLETIYHDMHFAIEQAVVTGDFQEMAARVADIARERHVEHRLTVDRDYVYLQIMDGDRYMYQVVSRGDAPRIRRV